MEADQNDKRPIWPWVVTSLSPAVVIAVTAYSTRQFSRAWTPALVFEVAYGIEFIICYLFFRVQRRYPVSVSLIYALGAALAAVVLNIIFFVSIFFVGCLCVMSGGFGR